MELNNLWTILTLQIVSCAFLTGLIWTIQILHYPAFAFIAEDQFAKFHSNHTRNITFIVFPAMLIELVTAVVLNLSLPYSAALWVNTIGVIAIWLCTLILSVPLHNTLTKSQNLNVIKKLVVTNLFRTFLWSARLILITYFFSKYLETHYVPLP